MYEIAILVGLFIIIVYGMVALRGLLFMGEGQKPIEGIEELRDPTDSVDVLTKFLQIAEENFALRTRIRSLVYEKVETIGIRKELQDYLITRAYEDLIINARVSPTIIESCNVITINHLSEVPMVRLKESIKVLEAFDLAFQRPDNQDTWYLRRDEIELVTSRFNNPESTSNVRKKSTRDFTITTEASKGES